MANATTPARSSRLPEPPPPARDLPAEAADAIERIVGSVRDKTTGPALTVARGIVYGTFATLIVITCVVMLLVALLRLVDAYLPDAVVGEDHMWATYLVVGTVFVIVGAVLWSKRHSRGEEPAPPQG
jgi:hypothetical protein